MTPPPGLAQWGRLSSPTGPPDRSRRRATRQRAAISTVLDEAKGFHTAQQIHDLLRHQGSRVGLATVYRTLQALASSGEVDVIRSDAGEALYRRCGREDHHHHLLCRSCGRSVEVDNAQIEAWARRLARRHGYTSVTHTVEIYGLCRDCS